MVWKSVSSTRPIFQVQKRTPMEIFIIFFYLNNPHYFFVITSGDSPFFNDPIEFPQSVFSVPLEIPCLYPPCLDFLCNNPIIW